MQYFLTLLRLILRAYCSDWLQKIFSSPSNTNAARLPKKERIKRDWVKAIWLVAGILMLSNPVPPIVMIIALPTTFLSFMILDEMP